MTEKITKEEYVRLAAIRHAILRFLRFSEKAAQQLAITPQQHQILLGIKGRPGRDWATISEIADHLQVNHNAAVGLVNRGEKADLIFRRPDPDDGRTIQVHPTPKGEDLLEQLTRVHRDELGNLATVLANEITSFMR